MDISYFVLPLAFLVPIVFLFLMLACIVSFIFIGINFENILAYKKPYVFPGQVWTTAGGYKVRIMEVNNILDSVTIVPLDQEKKYLTKISLIKLRRFGRLEEKYDPV